jgi:molybdate transport repressor ModE-like protein
MRSVTLKQLRALAAVIKTGSMTAAAKELNVTPPAITIQMQLLEQIVGMPLIERAGDGPNVTDAGAKLLAAARQIEAALADCEQELNLIKGLQGGRVTVGVVSTAKYFAPRALAAFQKTHPAIEVRLTVGNRVETIRALQDFAADVVIMGRPPETLDVERAIIGDHPHIIIASPDHRLARKPNVTMADLAQETFLVREEGSGTRILMESLFKGEGLEPTIGMEIGSNETIKQAVMADMGLAFISAHTTAAELADGRLVKLNVAGLPLIRQWFVVRRADKRLMPAANALWTFLSTDGCKYLPKIPGIEQAGASQD